MHLSDALRFSFLLSCSAAGALQAKALDTYLRKKYHKQGIYPNKATARTQADRDATISTRGFPQVLFTGLLRPPWNGSEIRCTLR